MERTPGRRRAATLRLVGVETSKTDNDARLRKQVDDLCIELFDRWCQRRELAPLVYLLHVWPFSPSTPFPFEAVSAALRDLSRFHTEALDNGDRELIASIHALLRD